MCSLTMMIVHSSLARLSAHYSSCLVRGLWAVVTFGIRALVNDFGQSSKTQLRMRGVFVDFSWMFTIYISIYSSSGCILLAVFLEVANYSKFQI